MSKFYVSLLDNSCLLYTSICIPNCDKIVPGMIMGALRCNIPTIFCSGGPMAAGMAEDGTVLDLSLIHISLSRPALPRE